ncbi:MAG: DUF4363 family protein [Ruminococcus sp.]|nr:DUF4363 family protein [Ruminococcus sp.]
MKRIYIAIAFLLFSMAVGIIEFITINYNIDTYMNKISKVEKLIKDNNIKKAEIIIKENAVSFEKTGKSILYCYYTHDELEEITEELYTMEDLLDDKRIDDYHEQSHLLMKKLLFIKEKEQITVQNIL